MALPLTSKLPEISESQFFFHVGNGNNSYLEEICVPIIILNFIIYVKHLTIRSLSWYRKHFTMTLLTFPFFLQSILFKLIFLKAIYFWQI